MIEKLHCLYIPVCYCFLVIEAMFEPSHLIECQLTCSFTHIEDRSFKIRLLKIILLF